MTKRAEERRAVAPRVGVARTGKNFGDPMPHPRAISVPPEHRLRPLAAAVPVARDVVPCAPLRPAAPRAA